MGRIRFSESGSQTSSGSMTGEELDVLAKLLEERSTKAHYNKWRDSRKFILALLMVLYFMALVIVGWYVMRLPNDLLIAIVWAIPACGGLYFGANAVQKFSEKGKSHD